MTSDSTRRFTDRVEAYELGRPDYPAEALDLMNRQGVLALWPVRMPGEDGRLDEWNSSALQAAEMARERWIRLVANMSLGANEVYEATGDLPDPDWPELSFAEILKVAFKEYYITAFDHPVIRRLRGEL